MDLEGHQRIVVVGSGGSGKSWLATRLGETTGLPVIHLDKQFWQPGWIMPPRSVRDEMHDQWIAGDRWIIDGNYASLMPQRFGRADLVIFLDISRFVCLWSVVRRQGRKRQDMPDDVREPGVLSRGFWQFCKWIWRYPADGRPVVLALHDAHPDVAFWRITNRREAASLVRQPQSHVMKKPVFRSLRRPLSQTRSHGALPAGA